MLIAIMHGAGLSCHPPTRCTLLFKKAFEEVHVDGMRKYPQGCANDASIHTSERATLVPGREIVSILCTALVIRVKTAVSPIPIPEIACLQCCASLLTIQA